jgi:uncharacterized membrane protein YeaQ/YmgE (transglycosylase-associated protein family)
VVAVIGIPRRVVERYCEAFALKQGLFAIKSQQQRAACQTVPRKLGSAGQALAAGEEGRGIGMLNIVGAIVSGLIVGALARWFYPGAVSMGWIATIALGVGGSLLAGLLTSRAQPGFNRAGCLASVLGAMALILVGRLLGIG